MADARLAPLLRHVCRLTPPGEPPDAALLERFAAGRDAGALEELVRRHGPLVWRVCRHMLPRVHDAEDAFQATFLALTRRASAIRKPESLAAWLHAAAFRIARRLRHDAGRRPSAEGKATAPAANADPAHEAAWRELGRLVEEEVAVLPDKYRVPLLLCYWQGRTDDETARQLGCPAGTVKTRLAQARQLLHDRLTRRGVSLPAGVVALLLAPGPGDATVPAPVTGASARVAALADVAVRTLTAAKRSFAAALVLATGLAVAGVLAFQVAAPPQQAESRPAAKPGQAPVRLDRFGDPLPEGAVARLGTMRFRHGGASALAFAPDDKSLISFGTDRTLRTWDAASGRLLKERRLPGRPDLTPPNGVLSPDGRLLAYQNTEQDAFLLWDVAGDRLRHRFALGKYSMHVAAFSPDSKTLVTAAREGTVRAWDVVTGSDKLLAREARGQRVVGTAIRDVRHLSFSAEGKRLLRAMSPDDSLCLWDMPSGRELPPLSVPDDLRGADLSPDGRAVVLWRSDRSGEFRGIEFRDADTGKPIKGWTAPRLPEIYAARFAPDGKTVWFGTPDEVVVWDPIAGKRVRTFPGGPGLNLTFSHDGKSVAALGVPAMFFQFAPTLRVWDLATGAPHPANSAESGHMDDVDAVAFSPDGKTVASVCTQEKRVRLWDALTGRPLPSLPSIKYLSSHNLVFDADGKHLFVGVPFGIDRWEITTGKLAGHFELSPNGETQRRLLQIHLSADGRSLQAVSNSDVHGSRETYSLHAWDVATGRRLRFLPVPFPESGYGNAIGCFSGDGRLLALRNGHVLDTATGKELLAVHDQPGRSPADQTVLSPDGALAAYDVWEAVTPPPFPRWEMVALQVCETATLRPVVQLKTGWVGRWAFTPDGRRLVTTDREALTAWDVASAKKLLRRPAPSPYFGQYGEGFASSFALTADSRGAATGHADGTILLWDIAPPGPNRPAAPLAAKEREALWVDLAGTDAGRALRAIVRLTDTPEQTVAMLRERLRPAKRPPAEEVRRLLMKLGSPRFEVRDVAAKRLAELCEGAHDALREALRGQPSLEVRRRIEPLLDRPFLVRESEARRGLRSVRLLEGISTPAARRVLEGLAKGADGMRLTDEARAALRRLAGRPAARP